MAVSCTPSDLATAAKCYCFGEKEAMNIMVYLLAQKAGSTKTPEELAEAAACYCYDRKTAEAVITYLLCQLLQ